MRGCKMICGDHHDDQPVTKKFLDDRELFFLNSV